MSNLHASSDELPKIVTDFFSNFKCDPKVLAYHLAHWGCEVKPTITLVIGSGNTGSSALIEFAKVHLLVMLLLHLPPCKILIII